jgi:hypothetical protein
LSPLLFCIDRHVLKSEHIKVVLRVQTSVNCVSSYAQRAESTTDPLRRLEGSACASFAESREILQNGPKLRAGEGGFNVWKPTRTGRLLKRGGNKFSEWKRSHRKRRHCSELDKCLNEIIRRNSDSHDNRHGDICDTLDMSRAHIFKITTFCSPILHSTCESIS